MRESQLIGATHPFIQKIVVALATVAQWAGASWDAWKDGGFVSGSGHIPGFPQLGYLQEATD